MLISYTILGIPRSYVILTKRRSIETTGNNRQHPHSQSKKIVNKKMVKYSAAQQ